MTKFVYLSLAMVFCTTIMKAQGPVLKDTLKVNLLDEVVITATRTERVLSSLPLPTTVITNAMIAKSGVSRLNEILGEQTGLITVPDFGGVEGIQMQGLDAAYTLILIDGVPLIGRSAGTLDLSRISVGNIDRIEIVKGASSSLYGSEAIAGVINIITKRTKKNQTTGSVSYKYGSFNLNDVSAQLGWNKNKLAAGIYANYFATSGFDLDPSTVLKTVEPFKNTTVQPKLYYDFSDRLKLIFSSRIYHQSQDYRSIISNEYYSGLSSINEWNTQFKLEQKINLKTQMEYELFSSNYKTNEYLNSSNQQLFESSFYNQWLMRPEVRALVSFGKSKLTSGIGCNYETLDRTYFSSKEIFNAQYVFSQFDYNPFDRLNVLIGFRYDHHNQYQSQLSPKAAINYKFSKSIAVQTSVGYGFKAPDFRQLYFDFTNSAVGYTVLGYSVAANQLDLLESQGQLLYRIPGINFSESLRPESSINFNFGSTYQKDKLKIGFNLFYNSISNLIDTKVVAQKTNGQNVFSYFNINNIFTYGLEYNSSYNFSKAFQVTLGYQYLIAKDKSVISAIENGAVYARDPQTLQSFQIKKSDYFGLYNRSKHTANIKFLYHFSKLKSDINLRVFYRSKYGLNDTNGNQVLDVYDQFVAGYFLANLSISKQIKETYTLQVGVNNLFDFTNPEQISNISGRQVFLKMQFNF